MLSLLYYGLARDYFYWAVWLPESFDAATRFCLCMYSFVYFAPQRATAVYFCEMLIYRRQIEGKYALLIIPN